MGVKKTQHRANLHSIRFLVIPVKDERVLASSTTSTLQKLFPNFKMGLWTSTQHILIYLFQRIKSACHLWRISQLVRPNSKIFIAYSAVLVSEGIGPCQHCREWTIHKPKCTLRICKTSFRTGKQIPSEQNSHQTISCTVAIVLFKMLSQQLFCSSKSPEISMNSGLWIGEILPYNSNNITCLHSFNAKFSKIVLFLILDSILNLWQSENESIINGELWHCFHFLF